MIKIGFFLSNKARRPQLPSSDKEKENGMVFQNQIEYEMR